jgi:hypothetical protein
MSLQSKDQKIIPNQYITSKANPYLIQESILNNQKENKSFLFQEKKTISNSSTLKETNTTNILNSKDLEIFNNLANNLVNSNKPNVKRKQKFKDNNNIVSDNNANSLIDGKNIEMEIYNKINNFSLKYSSELYVQKSKYNLASERSATKNKLYTSYISKKSKSNNSTPNKNNKRNKNFFEIKDNDNNNHNYKNIFLTNQNNCSLNNNTYNKSISQYNIFYEKINSSLNNSPFLEKRNNKGNLNASLVSGLNRDYSDLSLKSLLTKDYSSVNIPQKISKIYPENYENCDISSSEEKGNANKHKEFVKHNNKLMDRCITMKPKPALDHGVSDQNEFEVKAKMEIDKADENLKILKGRFAEVEDQNNQKSKILNNNNNEVAEIIGNYLIQNNSLNNKIITNVSESKKVNKLGKSMERSYDRSSFKNNNLSRSQISYQSKIQPLVF